MIDEKILVERLEEEINDAKNLWDDDEYYIGQANAYEHTIAIVNQLAEESKKNIEKSYISRTEVLLLIESIKDNKDIPKNYGTLLDIMRQIRNMPTVSIDNGWIPCSERMPEEPFGCLVTIMDCEPMTQMDFENILPYHVGYDGETWNDADGEVIPFEVIAWQPLPAPYQPKGGVKDED